MKTFQLLTTITILLSACTLPKIPGDESTAGDGDGDPGDGDTGTDTETETGEPLPDLPEGDGDGDGDPDPGWCCECGTEPMSCTPSSSESCTAPGHEWCLLDGEGNPSDCEAACEPEPEGWCCDCASLDTPVYLCDPSDIGDCSADGFAWCELDEQGQPTDCISECG